MVKQCIVIITRYPQSGQTKTRLIPVFGAEKAAFLSRKMTEETLQKVQKTDVNFEIHFSGCEQNLMEDWLGSHLTYFPQISGNLGEKMSHICENTLIKYPDGVIMIGTDCPHLSTQILQDALHDILTYDLVLGKAEDGGYYLIGMRNFIPQLFHNINWSTSLVFQQTVNIAQSLNLTMDFLPTLRDIDLPEDVYYYENFCNYSCFK